jgi:hypothetical protein
MARTARPDSGGQGPPFRTDVTRAAAELSSSPVVRNYSVPLLSQQCQSRETHVTFFILSRHRIFSDDDTFRAISSANLWSSNFRYLRPISPPKCRADSQSTLANRRSCATVDGRSTCWLAAKVLFLLDLGFLRDALAFERRAGLLKRLLIATKPSMPTVIFRHDSSPDQFLRGLTKVERAA